MITIFLCWLIGVTNVEDENRPIYIDAINQYIQVDSCNQHVTLTLGDTAIATIQFYDLKGSCLFELVDNKNRLLIRGSYDTSLAVLKTYITIFNATKSSESLSVLEYYRPIKIGKWEYFKENGKLKRTELYSHGVMIECNGCRSLK